MIEQPKTMGDCWRVYEMAGLIWPDMPMDSTLFANARILAGLLNHREDSQAELDKYKKALDRLLELSNEQCICPGVDGCVPERPCAECLRDWALSEASK